LDPTCAPAMALPAWRLRRDAVATAPRTVTRGGCAARSARRTTGGGAPLLQLLGDRERGAEDEPVAAVLRDRDRADELLLVEVARLQVLHRVPADHPHVAVVGDRLHLGVALPERERDPQLLLELPERLRGGRACLLGVDHRGSSLLGWVPSAAASASTGSRGRGAVSPPPAAGGVVGGGGTGVVGGGAWNTYGGPVVVAALFGTTMRSSRLNPGSSTANRPVCASRNTTPLRSWTTVNTWPGPPCREMATTPRVPSGSVDMMSTICP